MKDFVRRMRLMISYIIATPGTIRLHTDLLGELIGEMSDLRREWGFPGSDAVRELRFGQRASEHPASNLEKKRCALVLLGEPFREDYLALHDVHAYAFATPKLRERRVIVESDYLSPEMQQTAWRHLAEFSAWDVFYRHNPLNLQDHDFVCFLSSRKFERIAQISVSDIWRALPLFVEFLSKAGDIGAIFPYPDRDWTTTDATSFYHPEHFRTAECMRVAREQGLRHRFDNYTRIWRNYYVFRFDTFRVFMDWCVKRLVPVLFDEDFRPRAELIQRLTPAYSSYSPYRIFGLFTEFFHQRYFRERNASQFVMDKWLRVARIDYLDDELNWQMQPVGILLPNTSLAELYRFAQEAKTAGKRVILLATCKEALHLLSRVSFGTDWLTAIVDPELSPHAEAGELAGIPLVSGSKLADWNPDVVIHASREPSAAECLAKHPQLAGKVKSFAYVPPR